MMPSDARETHDSSQEILSDPKETKGIEPSSKQVSNVDQSSSVSDSTEKTAEVRACRCMFCGITENYSSEDEAVAHMRVCPALQEQLMSKEQFHIPTMLRK